jgi:hypothetical protein
LNGKKRFNPPAALSLLLVEDDQSLAGGMIKALQRAGYAVDHAANGSLIYENSEVIGKEYETSFSLQARYRYRQSLEPVLELYLAQD